MAESYLALFGHAARATDRGPRYTRYLDMPYPFRHAICNEVFEKWKFADTCKAVLQAGYDGIEIAPFTLAEDPATITAAQRREYRDMIKSEGLEFAGLHWLMVSPKGLHVSGPDAALRERSWGH